jgi:hypothetical protein
MTTLEHERITERTGMQHYCRTQGVGLDHIVVGADFGERQITFVEEVVVRRLGLKIWDYYRVEQLGASRSRLSLRFAFRRASPLTWLVECLVLGRVARDFEAFKAMCEREAAHEA